MKHFLMSAFIGLFSISWTVVAQESNLAAFDGKYQCIARDTGDQSKMEIDAKNGTLTVIRDDKTHNGDLLDKTSFLSPIQQELGFVQFVVSDQGHPIFNLSLVKGKSGKVLAKVFGDFGGYRGLSDDSKDGSWLLSTYAPDVVCTLIN